MYFGLSRLLDEQSLITFLSRFADHRLSSVLVPRLSEQEIHQLVDVLMSIMREHLSSEEYHSLFLQDKTE